MRARRQAVKQNRSITLTLADAHSYTIWSDNDNDGILDTDAGDTIDKAIDLHNSAPGVSVTNGTPYPVTLIYNSRGIPNTPLQLSLANAMGARNIQIRLTGHVELL